MEAQLILCTEQVRTCKGPYYSHTFKRCTNTLHVKLFLNPFGSLRFHSKVHAFGSLFRMVVIPLKEVYRHKVVGNPYMLTTLRPDRITTTQVVFEMSLANTL